MKQHNKEALVKYRIHKAKETIIDAKLALDNGRISNSLNRIYYSIFYIVSALAVKHDFSTSKHKQLMGWFNFNFVRVGIVSIDLWNIYKNSYENRQESDYEDFIEFEISDVENNYEEMLLFVSEIEKIINEDE
jgi:uncharacterized protein (UPF0332 family)